MGSMNPARKRTVRLVVALSAAVVLASALIYTSFSAASPALSPSQLVRQAQPGRSYQVTGTVVNGSVRHDGNALDFSVADRARRHDRSGRLHRHRARPVPRRPRGDRHRGQAAGRLRRAARLADHEVPLQVQDRSGGREAELLSGRPRPHLPAAGARGVRLWHLSRRCTACAVAAWSSLTPARRAVYALAIVLTVAFARAGDRVPAQRLRLQHGRRHVESHDADLLSRRGGVVLAGRLAAAVGVAAVVVVQPRAVSRAQADARRGGATRRRSCSASAVSSSP